MEKIAFEIKEAFDKIGPYIQRHTSKICPSCPKVCCINRHGNYEDKDIIFIRALGLRGSEDKSGRKDEDPCRFLSEKGCTLPRHVRPFRCTWYFCERLLESMYNDKPREYRSFSASFKRLQGLRRKLLEMNEGMG